MLLLIFMILFPDARVIIVANKIGQVKTGVFKYVKQYWANAVKRHGWLQTYFVLSDTMFYERSRKGFGKFSAKVIDSATKKRWRGTRGTFASNSG